VHALDDDVDLKHAPCEHPGCRAHPSFAPEGERLLRCGVHALDDDVDVQHPRCEHPGCPVRPSFAAEGERALRCGVHALDDDVYVVSERVPALLHLLLQKRAPPPSSLALQAACVDSALRFLAAVLDVAAANPGLRCALTVQLTAAFRAYDECTDARRRAGRYVSLSGLSPSAVVPFTGDATDAETIEATLQHVLNQWRASLPLSTTLCFEPDGLARGGAKYKDLPYSVVVAVWLPLGAADEVSPAAFAASAAASAAAASTPVATARALSDFSAVFAHHSRPAPTTEAGACTRSVELMGMAALPPRTAAPRPKRERAQALCTLLSHLPAAYFSAAAFAAAAASASAASAAPPSTLLRITCNPVLPTGLDAFRDKVHELPDEPLELLVVELDTHTASIERANCALDELRERGLELNEAARERHRQWRASPEIRSYLGGSGDVDSEAAGGGRGRGGVARRGGAGSGGAASTAPQRRRPRGVNVKSKPSSQPAGGALGAPRAASARRVRKQPRPSAAADDDVGACKNALFLPLLGGSFCTRARPDNPFSTPLPCLCSHGR
jgi:hypothetical protein